MVKLVPDLVDVPGALDAWLKTLDLQPHQLPIAMLARQIAARLDDPDQYTAASCEQFRRAVNQLVPIDAVHHKSQTNTSKITKGRSGPLRDTKNAKSTDTRARADQVRADVGSEDPASVSTKARRRSSGAAP